MKKILLTLGLLGLSSHVSAIENGTAVSASSHPDLVEMNCTGTVISGDWVLTAAHCDNTQVKLIGSSDNNRVAIVTKRIDHPEYIDDMVDISVWKLDHKIGMNSIKFLAPDIEVLAGKNVTTLGFGQTEKQLNYAINETTDSSQANKLTVIDIGEGIRVAGDSGSPMLFDGKIVAITKTPKTGTKLSYAKDFILNNIDAWHYPTLAVTNGGNVTVEVQSLHRDTFIDNATASGDATITGGSCFGATVEPFDTCTYEIASNGYEGTVTLDADQVITINKGKVETTPPSSGDSGGSLGWLSLLCLGLVRVKRKLIL